MKITVIITSFKEPKTIGRAIEAMLSQKTKIKYNIWVSAPDEETLNVVRKYSKLDKRVNMFKDPGKGKSFALNLLFKKIKSDILILTDGDVFVNDKAIEEIISMFENPQIGCVTGRPVPVENKKTMFGYWANFLFDAAHRIRQKAFDNKEFIECSGYLFAFRKSQVKEIPLDVAEDSVIPYFFAEKGYLIGYASKAEVYVKNVDTWKDWVKQKTRTSKAHATLDKYVDTSKIKRVKSFSNESKGIFNLLSYPRNLKEGWWSILLVFSRFYMWIRVFWDTKLKSKYYGDNWERVDSTK
ncbi:MAG: glycosyltransferase family 2 protein [Nanoarchaeota archaeon]